MCTRWTGIIKCQAPSCPNHGHRCFKMDGWNLDHVWPLKESFFFFTSGLRLAHLFSLLDADDRLKWMTDNQPWVPVIAPVISRVREDGNVHQLIDAFWDVHAHDIQFAFQLQVQMHCPDHKDESLVREFNELKHSRRHPDAPLRFPSFVPDNSTIRIGPGQWFIANQVA